MKRLRLSLSYNPGEEHEQSQNVRLLGWNLEPGPPEYESVMLYIPLLCSVKIVLFIHCLFNDLVSDSVYIVLSGRMTNPLKTVIILNYI